MSKESGGKIVFMGSSDFAVPALESLNEGYDVLLAVVQPDKPSGRGNKTRPLPVKKKALELDIPVFQPENINSEESLQRLKSLEPDLFVVCAYGQILSGELLGIPKYGSLNIHGSLLPKLRGAAPVHRAIIDGMDRSGVSVMLLDEGMDTGPVLSMASLPIDGNTTVGEYHDALAELGADILSEALPEFLSGHSIAVAQENESATYAPKVTKQEALVDFSKNAKEIVRLINGTDPFPAAHAVIEGKRVKLFNPSTVDNGRKAKPGEVIAANAKEGLIIGCADGAVRIDEIQYPGKRRMNTSDFFKGNSIKTGIIVNGKY